ncbi:lactonase family protein [Polaribacter reichenbachii]|nr:lactonase family protein [Polaribacter reichenbachii]
MNNTILFIGGYTEMLTPTFGGHSEGIYTLSFNENTGALSLLHITKTRNPGYLVISDCKQFLYTFTEVVREKNPVVKAYRIESNFSLTYLNELAIEGSLPCHISYKNNAVFLACYGSGSVSRFLVDVNGRLLKETHHFTHKGSSVNKERQEMAHAHQVLFHPKKKELYVADLGIDAIKTYNIDNGFLSIKEKDIITKKGFGPRHIVFSENGKLGYCIGELTGEIAILKEEKEKYIPIKYVQSLPKHFSETPSASALRIHPNQQFLYAANRTLDAITIFSILVDDLVLLDYQFTNGKTLREFHILPSGKWLIACLQDSDETVVYQIKNDGTLIEKNRTTLVKSGVCIAFL